jgi:ankyrin repeat protein
MSHAHDAESNRLLHGVYAYGAWHPNATLVSKDAASGPFHVRFPVSLGDTAVLVDAEIVHPTDFSDLDVEPASTKQRASALLIHAARAGEPALLRQALKAGADTATRDARGLTALMHAAKHGHLDCVHNLLFRKGRVLRRSTCGSETSLDLRDEHGRTALTHALEHERTGVVTALLDAGADVQAVAGTETPLAYAAFKGNVPLVVALLRAGAVVDRIYGDDRRTALVVACRHGRARAARALLDEGGDATHALLTGWTPLLLAAKYGHVAVVRLLLLANAEGCLEQALPDGWTALMVGVQHGHVDVARVLLQAKADVEAYDSDGLTPLMIAARHGRTEMARMLLAAGARLGAQDDDGWTALTTAARNGHADVVRCLVAAGAAVDTTGWNGWTPLMGAAQNDHADVVDALVRAGAKLEARDADGYTALAVAASRTHLAIVARLLQAGADASPRDVVNGWTPLMLVCSRIEFARRERRKHEAVLASATTPRAVWTRRHVRTLMHRETSAAQVARALLRAGARTHDENAWGRSAFAYAAARPLLYWELVRRAVAVRPYALHWLEDYARRTFAPDSEHMDYQRAAWAEDARECELVYLRAQVRALKRKRGVVGEELAAVRHRLGM